MADNDTPNRAANKDKAEGEREDVVNRHPRGHDTPRRYEEPENERNSSSKQPSRS